MENKNFEENPLQTIAPNGGFCGIFKTIACIGDSLASGEFESKKEDGKISYHDWYEYSWGQCIARHTGSKVYNFSRGGKPQSGFDARQSRAGSYVQCPKTCKHVWGSQKNTHSKGTYS